MKIEFRKNDIEQQVKAIYGIIDTKQVLPILSSILFTVNGNDVKIVGSNSESTLKATCKCSSDEDGKFTLQAERFYKIVKALPENAVIRITTTETRATITSGKSKFVMNMLSPEDYPELSKITDGKNIQLEIRDVLSSINTVQHAMPKDDVRFYLNGIFLRIMCNAVEKESSVDFVATDGHRLSVLRAACNCVDDYNSDLIIPEKSISGILKIFADRDGIANIALDKTGIEVSLGEVVFYSRLISGAYPDYNKVIPEGRDWNFSFDRMELYCAIDRAAIMSIQKFMPVEVHFESDKISVTSINKDDENGEDVVEVQNSCNSARIGFNALYLMDALRAMSGDTVTAYIESETRGVLFTDGKSKHVVMPIRI